MSKYCTIKEFNIPNLNSFFVHRLFIKNYIIIIKKRKKFFLVTDRRLVFADENH